MITLGGDGRPKVARSAVAVGMFRGNAESPLGRHQLVREEVDEEAFPKVMVDEGRLIDEFEVERTYGMH